MKEIHSNRKKVPLKKEKEKDDRILIIKEARNKGEISKEERKKERKIYGVKERQ